MTGMKSMIFSWDLKSNHFEKKNKLFKVIEIKKNNRKLILCGCSHDISFLFSYIKRKVKITLRFR